MNKVAAYLDNCGSFDSLKSPGTFIQFFTEAWTSRDSIVSRDWRVSRRASEEDEEGRGGSEEGEGEGGERVVEKVARREGEREGEERANRRACWESSGRGWWGFSCCHC